MRNRRRAAWVALLLAVGAIALAAWLRTSPPPPDAAPPGATTPPSRPADAATVVWVADGDTLDVTLDGTRQRVRLLNIDAPELGHGTPTQCLAAEARDALASLTPVGSTVRVTRFGHDRFGRLLAGVRTEAGLEVSVEVVRRGLAAPLVVGGDTRLLAQVLDARDEAAAAASGLHSPGSDCTIPGRLTRARKALADAQGPDAAALAAARVARVLAAGITAQLDADARDAIVQALRPDDRDRARVEATTLHARALARVAALEAAGVG